MGTANAGIDGVVQQHRLVGGGQFPALGAMAHGMGHIVSPEVITAGLGVEDLGQLLSALGDIRHSLGITGAAMVIGYTVAVFVHTEPLRLFFKHATGQQPGKSVHLVFHDHTHVLSPLDQPLRFGFLDPRNGIFHSLALGKTAHGMNTQEIDTGALQSVQPVIVQFVGIDQNAFVPHNAHSLYLDNLNILEKKKKVNNYSPFPRNSMI